MTESVLFSLYAVEIKPFKRVNKNLPKTNENIDADCKTTKNKMYLSMTSKPSFLKIEPYDENPMFLPLVIFEELSAQIFNNNIPMAVIAAISEFQSHQEDFLYKFQEN